MAWYARLTLGKKILAGFLLAACVAGLSGIVSTGVIWDVTRSATHMYQMNLTPIRELTDVVRGYQTSLTMLRDIIIEPSPQGQNDYRAKLIQTDRTVQKDLEFFIRSNRSPEVRALHKQINNDLKLYRYFRDKIIELAMTGHRDEAVNMMRNQAADVIDRIDGTITRIMAINDAQALRRYNENSSTARTALVMNLLCLLLGVTTAIGLGWFLANGITKPLHALTSTVHAIANGDLSHRMGAAFPADSHNEVHILSRHLDQMASTLHGIISRVTSDARQLSASSSKLNVTTEAMAQRAEVSATRIDAVSVSSGEMNLTASEIARNCSTAATNAAQANDGVHESQQVMHATIDAMQRIGEYVQETAGLITELGSKSVQINTITATIDDIADQTNLLALNAAIEAARAGDHGRGFAVVADEVRALAARTSSATKEISSMIRAIQTATNHAIAAMGRGVAEVEQGRTMVTRTGEALQNVAGTIQTISAEVAQIATAAEEQSTSIEEITAHIREVTTIICENASGTQEFTGAAAALEKMAGDLQGIVARFKLQPAAVYDRPTASAEAPYLVPGLAPSVA